MLRRTAAIVVTAGLTFGLLAAPGGASTKVKSPGATSAVCAQLRRRLARAPATLRRVDANLQELQALLPNVKLPARRAIVEQRIQRLEQLRTALSTRIEDARAACGTAGNTT